MSKVELSQRLEVLNQAIHSGERTVTSPNGASVTYRSLEEMLRARRDILGLLDGNIRPRVGVFRAHFTTLRGG